MIYWGHERFKMLTTWVYTKLFWNNFEAQIDPEKAKEIKRRKKEKLEKPWSLVLSFKMEINNKLSNYCATNQT